MMSWMCFIQALYNVCNFLEMSLFKQAVKLTFGRNKFGKTTVQKFADHNAFLGKDTWYSW